MSRLGDSVGRVAEAGGKSEGWVVRSGRGRRLREQPSPTLMSRLLLLAALAAIVLAAAPAMAQDVTVYRPAPAEPARQQVGAYPLAIGGAGQNRVLAVATDEAGTTYVTGDFTGSIDLDPGAGVVTATSQGEADVYVAAYDASGTLRWGFSFGSQVSEFGTGIAVADGRVFVGGNFNGTVNFGGSAGSITSAGSLDGFVLAVDAGSAAFVWATRFGGSLADGNPQLAVAGGHVLVNARYIGPATFGTTSLPRTDSYDAALASLSASTGAFEWTRTLLSGTGQQFEGGVAVDGTVYASATNPNGRTGQVGAYRLSDGAPIFEIATPGVVPFHVAMGDGRVYAAGGAVSDASGYDVWVGAFSTAGASVWANTMPGGDSYDVAQDVAFLAGRVLIGGEFQGTVDFDPGPGTTGRTSAGDADAFLARYEPATGALVDATAFGSTGRDAVLSLQGGASRGVLGGEFQGTVDLDPTPDRTGTRTSAGDTDGFVADYLPDGAVAGAFTVTTTAATGAGSLAQAIADANSAGGGTISFDIPGTGPHTITTAAAGLPFVTAPNVTIDGFTQPGSQPNTAGPWQPSNAVHQIILNGNGSGGSGLFLQGDDSTVRGLIVARFQFHGVLLGGLRNVIEGCVIGTDDAGTAGMGNSYGGIWVNNARNARVGGSAPAARNVVSGNGNNGILVYGQGASGTVVQGNFIGTTPNGAAARPNGFAGIYTGSTAIYNDPAPSEATDVLIGGVAPGEGNLISGNSLAGVEVAGRGNGAAVAVLGDTRIEGNRIGTNAAGTAAVPNVRPGIFVRLNVTGVTIGGATPGAGNVISGNLDDGVIVEVSDGIVVEGNLVGVDATGTQPLGNSQSGVLLFCSNNAVVRGNVASANGRGTGANVGSGIGGTCVITGVEGAGNLIVGNWVGTDRTGTLDLGNAAAGNGQSGMTFSQRLRETVVGGVDPADANVIAFNAGPGLTVRASLLGSVAVGGNIVYGNAGLGLDVEPAGRAVNDSGDADTGANNQQNFPVLATAAASGSTLTLSLTVDTAPANATYPPAVDVYEADADGQGQRWLGQIAITGAQAQTAVTAGFSPRGGITDGATVVATATDADGNTSEFSDPLAVTGSATADQDAPEAGALALAVVPNPARGDARVLVSQASPGDTRVEVYDALGRRMAVLWDGPLGVGTQPIAVDAARLPAGVYVVRVVTATGAASRTLTVVR